MSSIPAITWSIIWKQKRHFASLFFHAADFFLFYFSTFDAEGRTADGVGVDEEGRLLYPLSGVIYAKSINHETTRLIYWAIVLVLTRSFGKRAAGAAAWKSMRSSCAHADGQTIIDSAPVSRPGYSFSIFILTTRGCTGGGSIIYNAAWRFSRLSRSLPRLVFLLADRSHARRNH